MITKHGKLKITRTGFQVSTTRKFRAIKHNGKNRISLESWVVSIPGSHCPILAGKYLMKECQEIGDEYRKRLIELKCFMSTFHISLRAHERN
jgi:hypothetical protein